MRPGQTAPKSASGSPNRSEFTDVNPEELDFDVVNSVFSLRRPKDLKAGVASGSKSFAKGVLFGSVSLVVAPAVGAFSEGWGGFAKGVGFGRQPFALVQKALDLPLSRLTALYEERRDCLRPSLSYVPAGGHLPCLYC